MIFGLSLAVFSEKLWINDLDIAKEEASKDNKFILLEFSGSDWCPPCIRLNQSVFSQKEWKVWAKENLISVLIDFPNDRSLQTSDQQKINQGLSKKYDISGFPTILILDKNGDEIFRTGYIRGGPEKYIQHLKELAFNHSISFN